MKTNFLDKFKKILSKLFREQKKILLVLFIIFILIIFIPVLSDKYLVEIPKDGGFATEIIIGSSPRFINPVLAINGADKDLLPLLYSPLLKRNSKGDIVDGIVSYQIDETHTIYTLSLKEDISFSDEVPLTSDDILFTIKKIQDPLLKSPLYANWLNVETEKIDDRTLNIIIPERYNYFLNNLTKIYVMPKHKWEDISTSEFPFYELNTKPVGSGPFTISEITRDRLGKVKKYELTKSPTFNKSILLDGFLVYFFENINQYKDSLIYSDRRLVKNISSVSIENVYDILNSDSQIKPTLHKIEIPRIFGLFINDSGNTTLKKESVRAAIAQSIKKDQIIKDALFGYAKNINSPYLNLKLSTNPNQKTAQDLLAESKLKKEDLNFDLYMLRSPELENIGSYISQDLEASGIKTEIKALSESNLIDNTIRERKFDLLLFGYQTDIDSDLYYFFHSDQAPDPGVNISNISNKDIDKLSLQARSGEFTQESKLKLAEKIISKNNFIPLYSPYFLYITDGRLRSFSKKIINSREERFIGIEDWYVRTEKILPFFK